MLLGLAGLKVATKTAGIVVGKTKDIVSGKSKVIAADKARAAMERNEKRTAVKMAKRPIKILKPFQSQLKRLLKGG